MWSSNLEALHHLLAYLEHHLLFDAAVGGVCILIGCAIACMTSPDQEHDSFFHRHVF
jgi:hypothetical protein